MHLSEYLPEVITHSNMYHARRLGELTKVFNTIPYPDLGQVLAGVQIQCHTSVS